jgi:hypothetical protein
MSLIGLDRYFELAHDVACARVVMSQAPEVPPGFQHLKSPFTKVIATHYYDGPIEGFLGHSDWSQACVFRLLDWDRETDLRVFEIARVEDLGFEELVALLFQERLPRWPVWVLHGGARTRGEQLLDECFAKARPVATVTTRDLFGDITLWDPANDAPMSSGLAARRHQQDAG